MKQPAPENDKRNSTDSKLSELIINARNMRLAGLGFLTIATDLLIFRVLLIATGSVQFCQIASFSFAAILVFALISYRDFLDVQFSKTTSGRIVYGKFLLVSLFALLLRSAILLLMIEELSWQPLTALLAASPIGTTVLLSGAFLFVFPQPRASETSAMGWAVVTISLVTYTLVLKSIFMACIDLIPEEAYYWQYAQHLAWGYLDHPPMVAWLISLSTFIFGKSEVAVRLPAFICWLIAAVFMFRLTVNLCDRAAAFRAVLLLAVLPIFFGLGFFTTPDAPLYASWVGCLYFLERALIGQNRRAWLGAGLCLGLGMLSKYPAALLGLGALAYLLVDRRSRRWLLLPDPYLAAIIALLLFSPVLVWNMQNGWMSLTLQGSSRWSSDYNFSLHILLGSVLLLLTPMALLGIVQVLFPGEKVQTTGRSEIDRRNCQYLWAATFTFVPLSVFVIYSLLHKPQINWTAPVWLAAIPLIARNMVAARGENTKSWRHFGRRIWMPTIIALIFILGGSFYYIAIGLPGAGPMSGDRLFGEWRLLAERVGIVKRIVEQQTGSAPVVVGMDRNFISSELSFYSESGATNVSGSHLFRSNSLMWAFWFPQPAAAGMNVLMVDLNPKKLTGPFLPQYFESLGEIFADTIKKDGRVVGYLYWRVGYRYKPWQ